jgi:uncharacterized phage protein gp47/JayE
VTALTPNLDYTDRDYDALRRRLVALAASAFPEWTDFESPSFGTTLLELLAFVGDVLSVSQDQRARESRLVTATQRENVIALCQMLGYRLHGAVAATCDVTLTLARIPTADVTVPAGVIVATADRPQPVQFQLLAPVTFRAGQDPPRAIGRAEHSLAHDERADTVGMPDLELELQQAPYLDRSLMVADVTGAWTEVDTVLGSGPADRHFLVDVDAQDRATVRFGDGRNGQPPTGTLTLAYKTGGGTTGNIGAGALVSVPTPIVDASGMPVTVSVSNAAKASGGIDRETLAHAKLMAPRSLRAPSRSIAREDFEIHCLGVPGVARALMLTSNQDATIEEGSGDLLIVPQGGGVASPTLLAQALRQVTVVYPAPLTFQVRVLPANYRTIDIAARIYLRPGAAPDDVARRVRERLAAYFAPALPDGTPNDAVDFGYYLRNADGSAGGVPWSDIADLVLQTPGVKKLAANAGLALTLNGQAGDVELGRREFPALGVVALVNADLTQV